MKILSKENISKLNDLKKLKKLLKEGVPIDRRSAAKRLYILGEKDLGLTSLIKEMNIYKEPLSYKTTTIESWRLAAIDLGSLKDERAIDDLLEALPELHDAAAYGLAQIGTERVKKELLELASYENPKRLYALYGLGFMGMKECIEPLIEINENVEKYAPIYLKPIKTFSSFLFVSLYILGLIKDSKAQGFFLKNINESYIVGFLSDYWSVEKYSYIASHIVRMGHKIVLNYGWDSYLKTPQDKQAFDMRTLPDNTVVMKRRKEIVEKILKDVKEKLASLANE